MKSVVLFKFGLSIFFLILISLTLTRTEFFNHFLIADVDGRVSDNKLNLNCGFQDDMCLLKACLGKECSTIGDKQGFPESLAEGMLQNTPLETRGKNSCYDMNQKEEITNYNFRPTEEESDEVNSDSNVEVVNHSPVGHWRQSDSSANIVMDLGVIKNICRIGVIAENDDKIEDGYVISVSNDSGTVHKIIEITAEEGSSDSWINYDFSAVVGRFINLIIPGVSDFYDDSDPLISAIRVETLPLEKTPINSGAKSNVISDSVKQMPNITTSQIELSPLEYLNEGSDLLSTPDSGNESYELYHNPSTDISSTLNSNKFTGDIFLP
ncbi:MAG TPA: hypothetical protein VFH04_04340 [Nitrososphaeraceae archaeon]|nr:hypothetical protein [Nitrososphaeraceae archaeon]